MIISQQSFHGLREENSLLKVPDSPLIISAKFNIPQGFHGFNDHVVQDMEQIWFSPKKADSHFDISKTVTTRRFAGDFLHRFYESGKRLFQKYHKNIAPVFNPTEAGETENRLNTN